MLIDPDCRKINNDILKIDNFKLDFFSVLILLNKYTFTEFQLISFVGLLLLFVLMIKSKQEF